jgi:hypothetical protein
VVVEGRFPRFWESGREQRDLRQLVLRRHNFASPQAGGDTQPGEERTAASVLEQEMQRKAKLWNQVDRGCCAS